MMGDFNCEYTSLSNCDRFSCMHDLMTEHNFFLCDEMDTNKFGYIYRNKLVIASVFINLAFVYL